MGAERAYYLKRKKKLDSTTRPQTGGTFMLRCAELGLSLEVLDNMTVGMVYDMLIERGNDREQYPYKGKPGTLSDFLNGKVHYGEQN